MEARINYPANYSTTQNIEWLNATQALDVLDAAGIPFGLAIGNHDYDNMYYSSHSRRLPSFGEHALLVEELFRLRL